ncbi:MAG: short-chain dehydrogenase [Deltaproteobacteria bacterium]|nr:short-chain dehydrogenase [Deltaproteobacteria bacterium]
MGRLTGKVAVVTGATLVDEGVGIGGAAALLMAREGARVVVADVLQEPVERLAARIRSEGGEAVACHVDLRSESEIVAMVETALRVFGKLDILHNNAAAIPRADADIVTMDTAVWDLVMEINVRGTMLACKYAIPHMIKGGGGAIVNTSSGSGLAGDLVRAAYGVSKAAINTLTKYIATQYGKQGIRCNAVCPGGTQTPTFKASMTPELEQMLLRHTLTTRICRPEDLANVVVFLASDDAAMITGEVIAVDGGLLAHLPFFADFMQLGAPTAGNM